MAIYSMRLPEDLRCKLQAIADEQGRTLCNLIIYILRKEVERVERER